PEWELPDLPMQGFTPFRVSEFEFPGHPQEVSENSSDLGHFSEVHGYLGAELVGELEVEGPVLRSTYAVTRSLAFVGLPRPATLRFTAEVHGLGFSVVRAGFPAVKLDSWLLVLPTPIDASHVHL